MDSGKLLWENAVNHLKRDKRKKSSDDAATDDDFGASVLRGDVAWLDDVEDDGQRKTAVDNWLQSPKARKVKRIK